jgi:hypothetical protein
MENKLKKTIDRYMLRNEISNYKNDEVESHIKNTMFGGNGSESCLQNSAIFNHTMQMLNNNQTTMVNGLRGGRVTLPRTYFDPTAKDNMTKKGGRVTLPRIYFDPTAKDNMTKKGGRVTLPRTYFDPTAKDNMTKKGGRVTLPRTYFDPTAKDNMTKKGGRVTLPSTFFNPSGKCNMVEFPKYTVTGDVSTSVIRQGIPATIIGGGKIENALSFEKFRWMTGGHFSNKQNRELFANYNKNLEKFTNVLKQNGGTTGVITSPKINKALRSLIKN